MTKAELIEALTPFSDELEIGVLSVDPGYWHSISEAKYGFDGAHDGVLVLVPNAPKIVLHRPALRRNVAL